MDTYTFNVVRINRNGPHKGEVHIIPNCRKGGYHMHNGRMASHPLLKAHMLLSCVSYSAAYWYARGLLQGERAKNPYPYVKSGRAAHWKAAVGNRDHEEGPFHTGVYREDFHADG